MDAAVSTLTALAVFESMVQHGAVRSVHGYKVVGRKAGVGWVHWEKWVERGFVLSADGSREVGVPAGAPRILQAAWRARPVFREGQAVGDWLCISAFDSVAAVAPSSPPPPMLSPVGNPQLKCLPNLYNDLDKVFRFQSVENLPPLIHSDSEEQQKFIHLGDKENISDDADCASDSDSESDEDPQSEPLPPDQKRHKADKRHVASITLVEIAQCFHLPIREASKTLKIGVSILKKKCREYGIPRWPHRKIKSLDNLIHDIEFVLEDQVGDDVQQEKENEKHALAVRALTKRKRMLEREKETIQQKPALCLMTETKQFREDVFKRRNKARRGCE